MDSWSPLFRHYTAAKDKKIKLPDGSRFVVLSDLQIPLHDAGLLDVVLKDFAPWWKPKNGEYHLFLNGDFLDDYNLAKYVSRAIPKFTLGDEIDMAGELLTKYGKGFSHKHFVYGNHEERWDRYTYENAGPQAEYMKPLCEVLELAKKGYDWVLYPMAYMVNGFAITHGEMFNVTAAASSVQKYGKSGTSGHVNRPQSHTHKLIAEPEPHTWFCTGMLCRRDIDSIIPTFRNRPWMQCFGIGEVHNGVVHFELVRVHHGAFRAAGRMFKVGA